MAASSDRTTNHLLLIMTLVEVGVPSQVSNLEYAVAPSALQAT